MTSVATAQYLGLLMFFCAAANNISNHSRVIGKLLFSRSECQYITKKYQPNNVCKSRSLNSSSSA